MIDIGRNLKKIRQNQKLSLNDVSLLCHVSKPMLSQIERGNSSPTINVLYKIATGLKIPLSTLLAENETSVRFVQGKEQPDIMEENGLMKVYTLFPFDALKGCEMFLVKLEAGCTHRSNSHAENVEEIVCVSQGKIELNIDGNCFTLKKDDAVSFKADCPHVYTNIGDEPASFYNTIFY